MVSKDFYIIFKRFYPGNTVAYIPNIVQLFSVLGDGMIKEEELEEVLRACLQESRFHSIVAYTRTLVKIYFNIFCGKIIWYRKWDIKLI